MDAMRIILAQGASVVNRPRRYEVLALLTSPDNLWSMTFREGKIDIENIRNRFNLEVTHATHC